MKPFSRLEALGQREKLDGLSGRFGLPHVPEYDLAYFRDLYQREISEAAAASGPGVERGRCRRLLGDLAGAAADFRSVRPGEAGYALALAWLGEAALGTPAAEELLTRALEADPALSCARLYRGAHRLLGSRFAEAARDLRRFAALEPRSAIGRMLLGAALERSGAAAPARAAYRAAAKLHPACSAAYLLLARLEPSRRAFNRLCHDAYDVSPVLGFLTLQVHRTIDVESERYLRRILRLSFDDPEKVGALYRRETTQSHFSHFPEQDYEFVAALVRGRRKRGRVRKLVKRRPDLAWAHAFFGRAACYRPGRVEEGVRHMTRAIELAPHAGWCRAWRANALRLLGRHQEALADFGEAIRLQPFYHRSFVWRAGLLRKLGRPQEALADLDRAVAMDPYYSLTFHERSMTRRMLGDLAGSALDLDRAFFLDYRYSWVFKTGRHASKEEISAGLAELDRAVAAEPRLPSFHVWRGQLHLQNHDVRSALESFEEAIAVGSGQALAFGWHGYGQLAAGEPAAAEKSLRRAVELEPRFWIARGWLAQAQFRAGRAADAVRTLADVLREKPETPWAYFMRGQMERELGRGRRAAAFLAKALHLDGKYPEAYLELAQARLDCGDLALAEKAADQCIEIAPNLGRAYLVRALVRQRRGGAERAVADYRKVMAEFPYLFNEEQKRDVARLLAAA